MGEVGPRGDVHLMNQRRKQSAERKLNDPPSVKPLLPHFPIVTSGQESIK
jgi:hypothetical protein